MNNTTSGRNPSGTGPDTPTAGVDDAALARMRTVARLLDDSIRVPGTNVRFGLDPVLGILPGAGDVAAAGLSLYIVFEAARQGVPTPILLRMLANIAIDTFAGSVPLAGDLFDAAFKANRRNVDLAARALSARPPISGADRGERGG